MSNAAATSGAPSCTTCATVQASRPGSRKSSPDGGPGRALARRPRPRSQRPPQTGRLFVWCLHAMALSFDPQSLPVIGVDDHLPALPSARLSPASLRRRFAQPPTWTPETEREPRLGERPSTAAAVLIALVQRVHPTVLLTLRTAHLNDHPGQISFPGGRVEPSDADAAHTALREAQEEVGLDRSFVEILGAMPTYTTGTGFVVTPVVAAVRPGFAVH